MPDDSEYTLHDLTGPRVSTTLSEGNAPDVTSGHLIGLARRPLDQRDQIIVAFDEHYTANGNAVFSAMRNIIQQTDSAWRYRVYCRGAYRGPRLASIFRRIRVIARPVVPFGEGTGWRDRIRRILARARLVLSNDAWIANCQLADRPLLSALYDVERVNAIVVFTVDPEFALWVARLAHVFSRTQIPHIVVITPEDQADPKTVSDLNWLRVTMLRDSSLLASATRPVREIPSDATRRRRRKATRPILFDHAAPLSFLDLATHPDQVTSSTKPVCWTDWISPDRRRAARVRDVVLFIRPDWMSCGSGTTFTSLADYFRANDTLMIDVGIWPYPVPFTAADRDAKIAEQQQHIRSALYMSLRRSNSLLHLLRVLCHTPWFWPTNVVNQALLYNALAAKPKLLRTVLQRAQVTHIYLNHYFTYLFAKEFINGRKFFMDTHDIQSVRFVQQTKVNALTGRGDEFRRLLRHEIRILQRAERLSFVSLDEMAMVAEEVAPERMDFIIALPPVKPCAPRAVGTPRRLLIVASNNAANQWNIRWFVEQVWPKVLATFPTETRSEPAPLRPHVIVCGGIADSFKGARYPGIRFHGIVEDLQRYYELSDIVLLPVIMGAGVVIKTIEAVLYERPVVATRHALRGLPSEIVDAIGYVADADEFAGAIVRTLRSTAMREQQLRRVRTAAQLLHQEQFYRRLARAMASVHMAPAEVVTGRGSLD